MIINKDIYLYIKTFFLIRNLNFEDEHIKINGYNNIISLYFIINCIKLEPSD